jgi:biotin carboxylase
MVYLETSPVSTETRASNVSDSYNGDESYDESPHVVFITGAVVSKSFQFEAARRLGLKVVIVDSASSAGGELQKTGLIDLFIPLEISADVDLATLQVVEVMDSLNRNVVGVVTFMEMAVLLTSRVANNLGLSGLCPRAVSIARDKARMREAMRAANLASVSSATIKSRDDIERAGAIVGFPAVLKPIIGADSLGVKRVDSLSELVEAFDEGVRVMCSLCITSGLLSAPAVVTDQKKESILPVEFLLEEYLDGPEVDVDVLLHEGTCCYAAVSDNGPTVEPYFTETYGVLPSLLPRETQDALIKLSVDSVVLGLGLNTGLFHIEAKMTSRGPRLIEINARLGGGPICEMHKQVSGINLAEQQIRLAIGLPPANIGEVTQRRAFAYMTTNAIASGIIGRDLGFLRRYSDMSTVSRLSCRVNGGDKVTGPEEGQPSWLVEIWMQEESMDNAKRLVDNIVAVSDEIAADFARNYER